MLNFRHDIGRRFRRKTSSLVAAWEGATVLTWRGTLVGSFGHDIVVVIVVVVVVVVRFLVK